MIVADDECSTLSVGLCLALLPITRTAKGRDRRSSSSVEYSPAAKSKRAAVIWLGSGIVRLALPSFRFTPRDNHNCAAGNRGSLAPNGFSDLVALEVPQYRRSFLVRDNDGAYGEMFRRRLRSMGIRDRPIAPRSPWQNDYVERAIGTIRRECLDHIIVWSEAYLRRVLKTYAAYYNATRTHLGLDKDAPNRRPIESHGTVIADAVLGGLHHRYSRI